MHEFVVAEGLTCLIKVGAEADQNYQNYILRGTRVSEPHGIRLHCHTYALGQKVGLTQSIPKHLSFHKPAQSHVFTMSIDTSAV